MSDADTNAQIERLEQEAIRNPGAYQLKLAGLALLGYFYVIAVCLLLLALGLVVLGVLIYAHLFVLFKLSLFFLLPLGYIFKSMWVKFDPPDGIELKKSAVPKLFELTADIRTRAGGPKIHTILLTDDFNCAIVQFPRLGLFGFHKNYLILGMPFLESISTTEFEAVLAHEMGHLSSQHGVFGCWVSQVQNSWIQTYVNLSRESAFGLAFVRKFAEWFVPKFGIQSLVLRRAHELAADQISASITSPSTAANALIATSIKGSYMDDQFWPKVLKLSKTQAEPPSNIFALLATDLQNQISVETVVSLLKANWGKHDPTDSHPALALRVAALEPQRDWSDLDRIAEQFAQSSKVSISAARSLLGGEEVSLSHQIEQKWHDALTPRWKAEYQKACDDAEELAALERDYDQGKLSPQRVNQFAALVSAVKEEDQALPIITRLVDEFPDRCEPHRYVGLVLLSQKNEDGIKYLEKTASIAKYYAPECYAMIGTYLKQQGKESESETYLNRAVEAAQELDAALEKTRQLSSVDVFEEHTMRKREIEYLCAILHQRTPNVESAFLVKRMLPQEIGGSNYVLVVQLNQKESNFTKQQQATAVAVQELARYDIFNAFYLLGWDDAKSNLKQSCETLSNAKVYDRAVWKPSNEFAATLRLPPSATVALTTAKSHRRKTVIVVSVLIALLAGFAFLMPHNKRNEQSGSPEGSYQNDHQQSPVSERTHIGPNDYTRYIRMLQLTIKKNWFPPHLNHSTRTVLVFKVFNNGRIGDVKVSKSSGDAAMDKASLQAIYATSPFQPLPSKEKSVDVEFTLDYNLHQK